MAGFVAVICATFLSDKLKVRGPIVLTGCSLAIIGYIILLIPARPAVHYGGSVHRPLSIEIKCLSRVRTFFVAVGKSSDGN